MFWFITGILRVFYWHFITYYRHIYATVELGKKKEIRTTVKEIKMFKNIFEGTIVDGNSGQDGLEYVALAAIILVVLVIVGRLIAQKLQEGGEAATGW